MIYDNILQTIGDTPIVRVNRMGPEHVELYVKVEFFNPLASVKDRLAHAIVQDALDRGSLKPGQTVIEATSGNTGIALAMVCAALGHQFVATMADSFSVERRKIMRGLGAKVILTPAAERGSGMVKKAEELADEHGWFLARQFENPANPAYHANTTGPEILRDFAGRRLPRNADTGSWHTQWMLSHLPVTMSIAAAGAAMVSLVEHGSDSAAPAETAWLLTGSVAVGLVSMVLLFRTLGDFDRLPSLYRRGSRSLLVAAVAVLALGWWAPAPWVLASAVVVLLGLTWVGAIQRWARMHNPDIAYPNHPQSE